MTDVGYKGTTVQAYYDLDTDDQPESRFEKYTVFVKFAYGRDDYEIEEIDVIALNEKHAKQVGEAAMAKDYDPGGKVHSVVHRPRGIMYM